ncbi:uncharacterized protein [Venturia canescens]|uniref:uncharacterized protein isoform X3 n=1 Tax=Venturia canescens TaxID=32260 RepID=UPI001C9C2590|nr:uncharacterized protein LOC122410022 isoform X3 [Venturia canescens]
MSMRFSNHRPAVTECPSARSLMPGRQSPSNYDIVSKDSDKGVFAKENGFFPYEQQSDLVFLDNSSSSFCGRRAMVNKIWCRKVARAWLQAKPETPHARVFSEPKCQDHVRSWYLIYRCMILLAWLTIVVCSIFECGSVEPLGNHHKWPIYLTNWDLALGTAQASLAFCAGGSDKRGYTYIYKVLNWEKPGIALSVSIGGLTFVIIVHCLLCLITTMRERSSGRSSEKYSHEPIPNPTNEQTMKSVEIV